MCLWKNVWGEGVCYYQKKMANEQWDQRTCTFSQHELSSHTCHTVANWDTQLLGPVTDVCHGACLHLGSYNHIVTLGNRLIYCDICDVYGPSCCNFWNIIWDQWKKHPSCVAHQQQPKVNAVTFMVGRKALVALATPMQSYFPQIWHMHEYWTEKWIFCKQL